MFNKDFYPTPRYVLDEILCDIDLTGKVVYDPEGGKGDIVDYCKEFGAKEVLASEIHDELRKILASKCKVIGTDFLQVTSDQISHVDMIIMNPPFSADEKHILHAYNIAPSKCKIYALCNLATIENPCNRYRRELKSIIDQAGQYRSLGPCFSDGERYTNVEIGFIEIVKGGQNYEAEFEGFFMEEEIEEQANGIMPYNFVRDLVNRYVGAVKLYDKQLELAVQMNELTGQFFSSSIGLSITEGDKPKSRNEYKKDLQKSAWSYIFKKMNMQKYATKNLKDDINKFVEQQQQIPFTMQNIYRMLEIVIGTHGQRMDRVMIEVFDKLTMHYDDNRYGVEGWKTNSHYLINPKFIIDWMVSPTDYGYLELKYNSNAELLEDLMKALCYITGKDYNQFMSLDNKLRYRYKLKNAKTGEYLKEDHGDYLVYCMSYRLDDWSFQNRMKEFQKQGIEVEVEDNRPKRGEWFDWGFFECRGYNKGSMHFKFKDMELWAKFNQHIARIKGYPLFEFVKGKGTKKTKQAA